jgi:hypothetical protein
LQLEIYFSSGILEFSAGFLFFQREKLFSGWKFIFPAEF